MKGSLKAGKAGRGSQLLRATGCFHAGLSYGVFSFDQPRRNEKQAKAEGLAFLYFGESLSTNQREERTPDS